MAIVQDTLLKIDKGKRALEAYREKKALAAALKTKEKIATKEKIKNYNKGLELAKAKAEAKKRLERFSKENIAKQLDKTRGRVTKVISSASSVSPELKAQRQAQMAALRARKARLQGVAQASDQQQAAQGQAPNKFARILTARKQAMAAIDANRRFHSPIQNFATQMNEIHAAERELARSNSQQFNILKAHENMAKVNIDFTDTTRPEHNILTAQNVFRADNPANTNILVTGRRSILDVPEEENLNKTKMRLRFF